MTQEPFTLYKLIVLYMLDVAATPLPKNQIMNFMLNKDYTHFMSLAQVLGELQETEMIRILPQEKHTLLLITDEGRNTLQFFENDISEEIKKDVKSFLIENKSQIKNEINITAEYNKVKEHEYVVSLKAIERGSLLAGIQLSVPTESDATLICENWHAQNQEIYQYLTRQLFYTREQN